MRKFSILAVMAMAMFCLAGVAMANTLVDLDFVRVDNAATASVYADGLGNQNLLAGNYILNVRTPSGSGNPFVEVSSYCVEPTWAPTSPQVYELFPITSGSLKAVAWILSQDYTTLAPAAQAAAWELAWDWCNGNTYDLDSGYFRLYSGVDADDVKTIFDAALAAVGAGFDASGYVLFHSPLGGATWENPQDYIGRNPVPIPPSALLMGSGLLGIGLLGWRRKAKEV